MSKNNTPISKKYYYIFIVITLLITVGFLLSLYIKNQALEKITAIPGITCKNLDFNLLSGCFDLEDLSIERAIGAEKTEFLTLKTSEVHVHGLSYWQILKNNKVCVNEFKFSDLALKIKENAAKSSADTTLTDAPSSNSSLEEILIKKFSIEQGNITIEKEDHKTLSLDTFTTQIQRVQFFPNKDSQQIAWENMEFFGRQFLLDKQESDNQLLVSKIALSKTDNLQIENFRWKPKYGKSNYLDHHKYRKARIDIAIPELQVRQFPVEDLIFQQQLKAQAITAQNGVLKIYSDKNKPECTDCSKNYHYEELIESDLMLDIDSLLIKNSEIVLEELGEGKEKAGKLDWSNVYASIYNVTNNKAKVKTPPHTVADIQAVFVDDGNVKLHFEFPNFNKNADYRFQGSLDKVKLKKINSFLVFSKQFRIKQGEVNSFVFKGRGNLQESTGEMELRYNNLDIQLLKKDRSPRKFLSKIANAFFGKENNPDKENKLHKGQMYFKRDKSKSFISNWWKTMQSGIKSTMLPNILLPDELESTAK